MLPLKKCHLKELNLWENVALLRYVNIVSYHVHLFGFWSLPLSFYYRKKKIIEKKKKNFNFFRYETVEQSQKQLFFLQITVKKCSMYEVLVKYATPFSMYKWLENKWNKFFHY